MSDSKPIDDIYTDVWRGQRVMKKKSRDHATEESLRHEAAIHKDLTDEHLVQYYGVEENPFELVMEYVEGGNLKDAIPTLLWEQKRMIAGQIAHGLDYIHGQGIVHCDIKSLNVLLTKNLEVKICDFGSARYASDTDKEPICGTAEWLSPELLEDLTAYSFKSDIYALGVVMWEMATGNKPEDQSDILTRPNDVPDYYWVTMQDCLNADPKCRPSARELSFMKYDRGVEEEIRRFLLAAVENEMAEKLNTTTPDPWAAQKVDLGIQAKIMTVSTVNYGDLLDSIVPNDGPTEKSLLESANKGCELSKAKLALYRYKSGEYSQALELARQVGHIPLASAVIGEIYRHGRGVKPNGGEASKWHRDAADGGFLRSQVLMGQSYAQAGHHVEAANWFCKAANGGDSEGQYYYGEMIYYGRGKTCLDREEGACWIQKAADQGNSTAADGMAVVSIDRKEYSKAMDWLLKSGTPMADFRIGNLHYKGLGTAANCAAALEWFHKAADRRCGPAAFRLGEMYYNGEGVDKDLDRAIEMHRRGDEYGHTDSTNALAIYIIEQGGRAREYSKLLKDAQEKGNIVAASNLILRDMQLACE